MKVIGTDMEVCFDCKCENFELDNDDYGATDADYINKDGMCKLINRVCKRKGITHQYCPLPSDCKYRAIQITKWNGRLDMCGCYESVSDERIEEFDPQQWLTNKANCKCPLVNYKIKVEYR